jgi:hypothetical protein
MGEHPKLMSDGSLNLDSCLPIGGPMEPAYAIRMLDALDDLGPAIRAHTGHRLC